MFKTITRAKAIPAKRHLFRSWTRESEVRGRTPYHGATVSINLYLFFLNLNCELWKYFCVHVVVLYAPRELWCWVPQQRYDLETLMKCVCKVLIYYPPKTQHPIMIWRCCSRSWILWGCALHEVKHKHSWMNDFSISNIRMVFRKVKDLIAETCCTLRIVLWFENASVTSTCCLVHLMQFFASKAKNWILRRRNCCPWSQLSESQIRARVWAVLAERQPLQCKSVLLLPASVRAAGDFR